MNRGDFIVPARSWPSIDMLGSSIREQFGLNDEPEFPVMELIEEVLDYRLNMFQLIVGDRAEMGEAEGFTDPAGKFIMLRDDVYDQGVFGQPRARFTAAHELGHFYLHSGTPLARAGGNQQIKPYMLAEPQANQFAGAVLMPLKFFSPDDTPEIVARRHRVSLHAAQNRLEYFRKKGLL